MNRCLKTGSVLAIMIVMAGCVPQNDALRVDLGDVDDYTDWLQARDAAEAPTPFTPEPLVVSAEGKVRAQPDIAVVTATITATDKNDSQAVDRMSGIINAAQAALANRNVETGFTSVTSSREFDQTCRNANMFAAQRHTQIQNDFYFNRRLDREGDTKTKRRTPKPRLSQQVCQAQEIKVATQMVIRIQPAEAAGEALRALADAGAKDSQLFGYDYSDYDALYQEAAANAVALARTKAETVARLSGAQLGELVDFRVNAPARQGRFGPQPNIIRPARPYQGQSGSVIDRQVNNRERELSVPAPVAQVQRWDGSRGDFEEDVVVVTAARKSSVNQFAERLAGAQRAATPNYASGQPTSNALSISLLSGPQTIRVSATLSYDYETLLNGKIIVEPET